jgi:hypothetical protein
MMMIITTCSKWGFGHNQGKAKGREEGGKDIVCVGGHAKCEFKEFSTCQ